MKELFFELPVGLHLHGDVHKEVELMKTNGVAEKVFVKKLSEKPFTWQGNVLSIATKRIGDFEIGSECREEYLKDGSVTIPLAVRKLSLADVNTMLVEIHRRCWVSFIPKQEVVCKYCTKKLEADINLDKIVMLPEVIERIENVLTDYENVIVTLEDGFQPVEIPKITTKEEYRGITDLVFNQITFRVPLLEDALRHEKYFSDSIAFWRRLALDCIQSIQIVEEGVVMDTLPVEFHTYYGLKIFNEYLSGVDLKAIRTELQEYLPTLPFAYYEECGCDEKREIPMVMDVSNFFSE